MAPVSGQGLRSPNIGGQIAKAPTEIRDQLRANGKLERQLRHLKSIDADIDTAPAGAHRLEWLQNFIDQDRKATEEKTRREARRANKRHLAHRMIPRMERDGTARRRSVSLAA